ncbi:LysR family transcriptional regulator [Listeria sp. FSL L7-1485]|uniref:LysR family transcriptional regulator n=1 Tax=Listeria immobilis TaxID=2713502 RepID=A0A7X1C8K2_9LIST|nr:LysR family transcriptional regulator [Listeria immobilis]MBC1482658.1 LysR family transcriptional regulator [Listeria immobilis]MBC1488328.1 LysR family transcriptional regulator [Listeria immobilis]MBC1507168.1 LysR family transcriptional regulator [Listeria immobilis]MBC1509920.1 LysR family transcriptional regulator [Listeria immobilis]MBC1535741.1 LysR family transcriptional regulator [Listeria immobilis]
MEIRMLKYFLTVAEEQNITQAAKKLHITQPTLSRQIRDFEVNLQTALFVRKNKKLYLTEPGLFLKKRAEEILELDEKTEQEFAKYQNALLKGQISIGCVEASNSQFLAEMLEEMIADHPQVTFNIYSGTSNDIKERLDKGLLDIALLIEPVLADNYHKLVLPDKEIWGLLVSTEYFLTNQQHVSAKEILGVPLIWSGRKEIQNMLCSWGGFVEEDLNVVGKYNLIFNVISLVENKVGAAFAIRGAIDNRKNNTKFLPLTPKLETNCVLIWKKETILSDTVLTFIQKMENALKA